MRYKAVVFDLFGTLVDYLEVDEYWQALEEIAETLSLPPDDFLAQWRQTFPRRMTGEFPDLAENYRVVCKTLGARADEEGIREAVKKRIDFTRITLKAREDAASTLEKLKEQGFKLALISDCSIEVPMLWKETPFAELIDIPVFSCTAGMKKPDPRIYHLACQRLGVEPGDCLYVGDGSSDELAGAARVGMHPVLIRTPYEEDSGKYRIRAADWDGTRISKLSEVLDLTDGRRRRP